MMSGLFIVVIAFLAFCMFMVVRSRRGGSRSRGVGFDTHQVLQVYVAADCPVNGGSWIELCNL